MVVTSSLTLSSFKLKHIGAQARYQNYNVTFDCMDLHETHMNASNVDIYLSLFTTVARKHNNSTKIEQLN